jgi:DNA-directed RNA polymerase subunit M/transcription elongation factor TFIIS
VDGEGEDGWNEEDAEDVEQVILPATKPKKSADAKKKAAQISTVPGFQSLMTTDPECTPSDPPDHPSRKAVLSVIKAQLGKYLPEEEQVEFEGLIFKTSLSLCEKRKIRKSWLTLGFKDTYLAHARTMIGNLNPDSYIKNVNLFQSFQNKEILLEDIVTKNALEIFPEHWQTLIDQQAKREQIQLEGDRTRATDRFQCKRCGKKETTYYELQTRSADEPMTIFINCLNCGKRWTQ